MVLRDLLAIGLAAGLIVAATAVSASWATFVLSGAAGLCIGLAGWDAWRERRAERYKP